MTREQAFLWLAELLMFLAGFCFVRAFAVRRSDNAAHQKWGKAGAVVVVAALVVLEILMRGFGWAFPVRSAPMLHAHIAVASLSLLLIVALAVTGKMRIRSVHVRLYLLFFPSYVATLVLSFLAFELW